MGHQTVDAAKDENSVIVTKKQAPEFEALRTAVEEAIVQRHQPQQHFAMPAPQSSRLDQLKQIGELRESGVLSTAEFESEKARIMADDLPASQATGVSSTTTAGPPRVGKQAQPVEVIGDTARPTGCARDDEPINAGGEGEGEKLGQVDLTTDTNPTERKAKVKRVGAAWATGGLSEVSRFAKSRRQAKE